MLWLLAAIVTALSWGTGDLLTKKIVKQVGELRLLLYFQLSALLAFAPVAFIYMGARPSPGSLLLFAASGAFAGVGYLSLLKAFKEGNLSVVSPIAGAQGMTAAAIGVFLLGDQLSGLQSIAIAFTLIGVPLVSLRLHELVRKQVSLAAGVPYALVTVFCGGVSASLFSLASESANCLAGISVSLAVGVLAVSSYLALSKRKLFKPSALKGPARKTLLAAVLLNISAYLGYAYALSSQQVSLAYPIAMTCPAVTVALAFVFLRERLEPTQYLGVFLTLVGIVLVAV